MTQSSIHKASEWFSEMGWTPHAFQLEAWEKYAFGYSGLVNAPTGSGKTYSLLMAILCCHANLPSSGKGLKAIWITPIRALAVEIQLAAQRAIEGLGLDWVVEQRTGDSSQADRARQRKRAPDLLITTPESLHVLLASKESSMLFKDLQCIVADEWHELLGSKRGVQLELALSRLRGENSQLRIWGISATIGNLEEALHVLIGQHVPKEQACIIKAAIKKDLAIHTLVPDDIQNFPWAGHLGIKMLDKVLPLIASSESTLVFTNTRAQCEIWYQQLLEAQPDLAGIMAMHHSSMDKEIRNWVEDSLHKGDLKVVVCTSSLDLGVDFRPVETVVQIGSPKGIGRFLQRAGRSGHRPGALSSIYFLPTHALELIEASALKKAAAAGKMEARMPVVRAFDVLIQYLVTLAVGGGLDAVKILAEVKKTFAYESMSDEEWQEVLMFVVSGGSLEQYEEYHRLIKGNDGIYRIANKGMALRHRLSIGTIVSDGAFHVQYLSGKRLGSIEEWFIAQLNPGEVFWFAGRALELLRIKENIAIVKKSSAKKGKIPSWMGGRMPLSSMLSDSIRQDIDLYLQNGSTNEEFDVIAPLLEIQADRSAIPGTGELLVEHFESREGFHLLLYPFEGRLVHEGMASLLAYRMAQIKPISFSIAMNDYGFELLSDQPIPFEEALEKDLFSTKNLWHDIQKSINSGELASRRFRDIASIAGLVFRGFPGREKREKHLKSSAQLIFKVYQDYDPDNLLFRQAFEEAMYYQLEEERLRLCLQRIQQQRLIIKSPGKFTPFAFPIIVDRLRAKMSSEKLEDKIKKMKLAIEKG